MDSRLGDRPCYEFGEYRLDANRRVIEALAANRRLLTRSLEHLWELTYAYNVLYEDPPAVLERRRAHDQAEHAQLITALAAGAGERARAILGEHVLTALEALLAGSGLEVAPCAPTIEDTFFALVEQDTEAAL